MFWDVMGLILDKTDDGKTVIRKCSSNIVKREDEM